MKMIDVFCGTKSMSSVFKERGHEVLTLDFDEVHGADIRKDFIDVSADELLGFFGWDGVDYMHFSPDCSTYSVGAVYRHRIDSIYPKTQKAIDADNVRQHMLNMLDEIEPTYFTIENPRGMLRKFPDMQRFERSTVTYCQYGFPYMKPTDIWHNLPMVFKKPCKNGDDCHVSAPRGSNSGINGNRSRYDKGRIPRELCMDICTCIENNMS